MANIGPIGNGVKRLHIFNEAHMESISRHSQNYFVVSGCDVHQAATPAMSVTVDSGTVLYNNVITTVAGATVAIDAADATNPRFDVVYINSSGTPLIHKGSAAAIQPSGTTDSWKMSQPFVATSIPAGVILAIVYVGATVTTILNAAIQDIAMYGTVAVTRMFVLTPEGAKIPETNGAEQVSTDGTNFTHYVLNYDASTDENAYWEAIVPPDYNGGNINFDIYWKSSATSGNCIWNVQVLGRTTSETFDSSLGSVRAVTTAAPASGQMKISSISAFSPSWAIGDYFVVKVTRDANNVSDTMAADASLLMVAGYYTGR